MPIDRQAQMQRLSCVSPCHYDVISSQETYGKRKKQWGRVNIGIIQDKEDDQPVNWIHYSLSHSSGISFPVSFRNWSCKIAQTSASAGPKSTCWTIQVRY